MKRTIIVIVAMLSATVAFAGPDNSKANWKAYCAMCHGSKGKGNTPAGRLFGVPNYHDPKVQASLTDEEAFKDIKNGIQRDGRMRMKSFAGELTDQDIREIVQYIRSFKRR